MRWGVLNKHGIGCVRPTTALPRLERMALIFAGQERNYRVTFL